MGQFCTEITQPALHLSPAIPSMQNPFQEQVARTCSHDIAVYLKYSKLQLCEMQCLLLAFNVYYAYFTFDIS